MRIEMGLKLSTGDGTLVESLLMALEDEIVSGRQICGTHLDEQRLADWFGVSRTPIREALLGLVATNLVEKIPRRGFIVKKITLQELNELFETMAIMEATCGRLCAERISGDELRQINALLIDMKKAVEKKNPDEYDAYNRQFHSMIYASSHNSVLVDCVRNIRRRTAPFRRAQFQRIPRIDDSHSEHLAIVNAISAGDSNLAYKKLYTHIVSAKETAFEVLKSMNNSASSVLGERNRQVAGSS